MTITVLAVDDSRTMRDMVKLTLQEAGIITHIAEDGRAALAALERLRPDAILTDINMPNLDGFGLIEAVRRAPRLGAVPILVLSTESTPALKARARAAGATGWVVKPFDPDKLVRALHMVAG